MDCIPDKPDVGRRNIMTDCLLIGFNDTDFSDYVQMTKSMGTDSGAYRDLNLAFVEANGQTLRSMDVLNKFYFEGRPEHSRQFSNVDFLWPVITYLGTYLDRRGHSFDYVNLFHLQKDELRYKLEHDSIRTVAITTTLYVSPLPILEIIEFVRACNDTVKIIVGGPFVMSQAAGLDSESLQHLFEYMGADLYVISQDGEATLARVLDALKAGDELSRIPNLACKQGKHYVRTTTVAESNPLEENMINYGLFPQKDFGEFVTLRTAKSCPFSCSFCAFPQHAGAYKYLSVGLVEKELNAICDIGSVSTLTFIDDTFNVPKGRFKELLRMMIGNRYGFKWNSFYRSDHGDAETIELMGKAGCEGVFLGIESGSDAMLEKMNKSARKKDYLHAIPRLREAGVASHANFIVGFPGETYESVEESIELIESARPDFFRAQLWYCDPITPVWQKRDALGIRGSAFNWSHNTMDFSMASRLVERMFLIVQESTWMPQSGFEQWSTFYLQRKGMDLPRIKNFLHCFNAAIKEKLLYPERKEVGAGLMAAMRSAARFDEEAPSQFPCVEALCRDAAAVARVSWIPESVEGHRKVDHATAS
jgi:anaerobic magnesium-protoporphyrin IX monomethyl ester cyclase